jgi:HD-like signal output (HDOD) protein
MNTSTSAATSSALPNAAGFAFVESLAAELSSGKVELPSFPDIAARVRQVLSDEFVSSKQIIKVVSSEPALAAKLVQLANSVALNPGGQRVTDLKTAISRMGLNLVRSASLTFAVEQMRNSPSMVGLRQPMSELWERCVFVAAMSYVVARSCSEVNADTALLAGLLHGVGRLYILARSVDHPQLLADQTSYNEIVRDWHAAIAKCILENWDMSDDIVAAVESHEDLSRDHEDDADLTDVLTVATLLVSFHSFPEEIELNMQGVAAFDRMELDHEAVLAILEESAEEVASLQAALGSA